MISIALLFIKIVVLLLTTGGAWHDVAGAPMQFSDEDAKPNSHRPLDVKETTQAPFVWASTEVTPTLTVRKTTNGVDADVPSGPQIPVRGQVVWTYAITNSGGVAATIESVVDSDPQIGTLLENDCIPNIGSTLNSGSVMTCAVDSGQAELGQYQNTVTVTAKSMVPPILTTVITDVSHYYGVDPDMGLSKQATLARVDAGDTITYTVVVTGPDAPQSTVLSVVDVLPAALTLLNASATDGQVITATANALHWVFTTTHSVSNVLTLTYSVRLNTQCAITIINTARLSIDAHSVAQAEAAINLKSQTQCPPRAFLPLLTNNWWPVEPAPVLANNNFDQGREAWEEIINIGTEDETGRLIFRDGETQYSAHSPAWFAWLGGVRNEESKIRQELTGTLPSTYPIFVQFHHYLDSAETNCERDRAELRIGKTGEVLRSVWGLALCTTAPNRSWQDVPPVNISLDDLKGQFVTVEFAAILGDDSRNSNFLVDTVTLCTTADGIPGIAKCPAGAQTAPSTLPATDSLPDSAPVARDGASDAVTEGSE